MKNYVDLPVPIAYAPEYAPLKWVKSHCPSYITNDCVQKQGDYFYRFYFGNERDMTMFILRWA